MIEQQNKIINLLTQIVQPMELSKSCSSTQLNGQLQIGLNQQFKPTGMTQKCQSETTGIIEQPLLTKFNQQYELTELNQQSQPTGIIKQSVDSIPLGLNQNIIQSQPTGLSKQSKLTRIDQQFEATELNQLQLSQTMLSEKSQPTRFNEQSKLVGLNQEFEPAKFSQQSQQTKQSQLLKFIPPALSQQSRKTKLNQLPKSQPTELNQQSEPAQLNQKSQSVGLNQQLQSSEFTKQSQPTGITLQSQPANLNQEFQPTGSDQQSLTSGYDWHSQSIELNQQSQPTGLYQQFCSNQDPLVGQLHNSQSSELNQQFCPSLQPEQIQQAKNVALKHSHTTEFIDQFKTQQQSPKAQGNHQFKHSSISKQSDPIQQRLNFDGSQFNQSFHSLPEFSPVSSPIKFQDYNFSDEVDSWDTGTDDELGLLQLSHRARSNSISSNSYLSSSGSSTETIPESTGQYTGFGPPPFKTPPKLREIQDVLGDHPGTGVANLRNLAISLAKDAIFGKDEMVRCSLSGRKNTAALDEKKLKYIKTIIQSRVPRMSEAEFESLWILCRSSISKSCQSLRTKSKRKLY